MGRRAEQSAIDIVLDFTDRTLALSEIEVTFFVVRYADGTSVTADSLVRTSKPDAQPAQHPAIPVVFPAEGV